ncbi:unnamed protein product [Ectocarpus sp. 13 AM-2016]
MGFQQAETPTFCAMTLASEHKLTMSNSLTSSRTSSPSPRITDDSPPTPNHGWVSTQPDYPSRFNELAISDDGESSILSSQAPSTTAAPAPAAAPSTPRSEAPRRRVLWTAFDSPPPGPGGGRELERRKTTFKIFVIFRGGWCTSSQALLKGFMELNPAIKKAGGKVVALSSQTAEQVGRAAHDMRLPFQAFGDPSNGLVDEMNIRFKMGCTVNRNDMVKDSYPHGMAQPCVLAVFTDDAQDEGSVLFRWNQWQTIASMRHADALAHITRAVASKADEPEGGPSSGTPTATTHVGLDGFATPPSSAAAAPPPARLPPRQPTPVRQPPRAGSPSSSFGRTGGYAPFGGDNVGLRVPGNRRESREGPTTAAGTRGGGRGAMAATAGAAADGALAVEWMRTGRDPASTSKPRAAGSSGGHGGRTAEEEEEEEEEEEVHVQERSSGGGGGRKAPPRARAATPPPGGGRTVLRTPRGGARGRNSHPEQEGGAFFFGREGYADHAGSGTGGGHFRRPPAGPSRSHLLPTYSQAAAAPATPTRQQLPPQHRRPRSDTHAQRGAGTGVRGDRPRYQKAEGTPRGVGGWQFWLGATGRARRASFDEAAADFERGGAVGGGGGGAKSNDAPGAASSSPRRAAGTAPRWRHGGRRGAGL